MLIEQLEKKLVASEEALNEYFLRMKMLENRLRQSEHIQIVQVDILTKRLQNVENRLSHVDELEMKLHEVWSRLSLVDVMETKLKELEKSLVEMNKESRRDTIEEKSALPEVKKPINIISKSDNEDSDKKWYESSINRKDNTSDNEDSDKKWYESSINRKDNTIDNEDSDKMWYESSINRKDNKRNKGHINQASGVSADRLRGLRTTTEDRVAFYAMGVSDQQRHDSGDRLIFASLAYSEGGGFDMSSGIFVCPKTGTYFFTGTTSSYGQAYVELVLKINGVIKMRLYAGYHLQGDNLATAVTISHCQAGQSVWMEFVKVGPPNGWQTISGFLLWSDSVSS